MAQIAKSSKSTQKREAFQKKQEEGGKKVLEYTLVRNFPLHFEWHNFSFVRIVC